MIKYSTSDARVITQPDDRRQTWTAKHHTVHITPTT